MAKYMLFIHDDEAKLGSAGPDVFTAIQEGHQKFATQHGPALRGGGRLAPSASARTVRDGTVTAEPFTPGATHAIGGFYIIEAESAEQAAEIAKDVPSTSGGVEVRELI
jgi:hypothetical protein